MNGPCTKGQTFLSLYWNKKSGPYMGHTWAICGPQMGHKKAKLVNTILAHMIKYGAPGAIRTRDLWLRKPTLYPAELRAQIMHAL